METSKKISKNSNWHQNKITKYLERLKGIAAFHYMLKKSRPYQDRNYKYYRAGGNHRIQ